MSYFAIIGTILSIHVLAWLMPGPIFFLIIRNSLVYSRRSGIFTAIGIACANFIHIGYSILGLTLLFSVASSLMIFVQYMGASYIAYLGFKTLKIKPSYKDSKDAVVKIGDLSFFEAAKTGFITNILSPKAALFFTSIFASILSMNPPYWVVAVLWVAMPINSFLMASFLSLFFTQKGIRKLYLKYEGYINKILGVILLVLAGLIVEGH